MRTTLIALYIGLSACGSSTPPRAATEPVAEARPADPPVAAEPAPADPPVAPEPVSVVATGLRWELVAIPDHLRMARRAAFRLRRQVTNTGSAPADAMRTMATFSLDGAPSMELDMAFGNGVREQRWSALPPGETVFDERAMGESLFPVPGDYEIAMTTDGVTSTTHVHVDR